MILESPSKLDAVQVTVAEPVEATALTPVGAVGGSGLGVAVATFELGPVRDAFSAWTDSL